MKVSVFTLFAIIAVAASPAFGAEDSHASHDDSHDDVVDCAAVNVTDLESCAGWCGDNYTATFEPEDEHGDTRDGVHVDFLIGYSCECEEEEPTSTTRADGHGGDDHHDEKHCMMHYELPTCESEGLAMCGEEGDNATVTCSELCVSLGLGTVNDSHICEHVEGEHDDHDQDRWLAEEDDHDGEEGPYTMCFCGAASVGKGTMVCADEGWEEEHHDDHGDGDSSSPMLGGAFASLMLSSALIAFM